MPHPLPALDEMLVWRGHRAHSATNALLTNPPVFVQGGRFGDILLLLPAFKAWADLTGKPTKVVSTREFGTVLEGCSYIAPTLLPISWHFDLKESLRVAQTLSPHVVVTQLHAAGWENPSAHPDNLASYSLSMWKRTGFLEHYHTLPLVIDKRHPARESSLIRMHVRTKRPLFLVNIEGWTSPIIGDAKRGLRRILEGLDGAAEVLHLPRAKAMRVYDQLGLMDRAAGMLTSDTMPLHLAPASAMPYIALVRDEGQSASIPKGNCILKVGYSEIEERYGEIEQAIYDLLTLYPIVHA